jgi:hypothetical protein
VSKAMELRPEDTHIIIARSELLMCCSVFVFHVLWLLFLQRCFVGYDKWTGSRGPVDCVSQFGRRNSGAETALCGVQKHRQRDRHHDQARMKTKRKAVCKKPNKLFCLVTRRNASFLIDFLSGNHAVFCPVRVHNINSRIKQPNLLSNTRILSKNKNSIKTSTQTNDVSLRFALESQSEFEIQQHEGEHSLQSG